METDLIKLQAMASDTIVHKKLVLDTCLLMANYLMQEGDIKTASDLLKRGCAHDNSKFQDDEFKSLASILKSRKCFTDAETELSEQETKAIEKHWKKNRHHPEYYNNSSEMSELDMLEMVCDWFARSLQYNTDFIPFVKKRQKIRFKFKKAQFKYILEHCELMERLYKESKATEES